MKLESLAAQFDVNFYLAAAPILILVLGALSIILFAAVAKKEHLSFLLYSFNFILLAALGAKFLLPVERAIHLDGSYLSDSISFVSQGLILLIALVVSMISSSTHYRESFFKAEILAIFLLTVCGMLVMVSTFDMITLFIGLEMSAIGLYALVGYSIPSRMSLEAALKYFVLGAFTAGISLMGLALLYADSGSLNLLDIIRHTQTESLALSSLTVLGSILFILGLCFKIALFPFHLWSPDVYEAAPSNITLFMITSVKIMVVSVLIRILAPSREILSQYLSSILMVLGGLSILVGNILALVQVSLKRIFAYSAIAHIGYLMLAFCAFETPGDFAVEASFFYLITYSTASILGFSALINLEKKGHTNPALHDIAGLGKKDPWTALALSTCVISLAGLPPTAGFMGKLFVFTAAIKQSYYLLVLVAALGSVISLYYYLKIPVTLYMQKNSDVHLQHPEARSRLLQFVIAIALILTIAMGTFATQSTLNLLQDLSLEENFIFATKP